MRLAQHLLSEGLAANHEGIAVTSVTGETMSYSELESLSNQFARMFRSLGVQRNDRIALCLEKRCIYLAAVIGALKADAMYVPIYDKTPEIRALQILEDCRPAVCVVDNVTQKPITSAAQNITGEIRIVALGDDVISDADATEQDVRAQPASEVAGSNGVDDIAYLLYTSGSTGSPKGVKVTHDNILDYAAWGTEYFALSSRDRILNTAPFYFDMSVFDIFCGIKSGATICLVTEKDYMFAGRFIDVAEQFSVTFWKGVSSMLGYLSNAGALHADRLASLKTVVFAGEKLPGRHLEHWMQTYPGIRFYNGYGPTEATGISTCYSIPAPVAPDEEVPVGFACTNTEIIILKEHGLKPCGIGETGEICIQGGGVSAGYWNDPKQTKARFVELPGPDGKSDITYRTGDSGYMDDSGLVWLTGRLDDQVKVQGFRIDLGDVASAVLASESVSDAAVMLLPDPAGNESLVAFVEAPVKIMMNVVKRGLRVRLPAYMVPKICHRLDRMPRTERGKLDKPALRQLHMATLIPSERR